MRSRNIVVVVIVIFVFIAVGITNVVSKSSGGPLSHASINHSQSKVITTGGVIAQENAQQGTKNWQISAANNDATQLQAYASATSVSPGHKIIFYLSTKVEGTPYSIDIYRLGWYGGLGGRLMFSQQNLVGHAQGYYNPNSRKLIGCNSCQVTTSTSLVEAHWSPSYSLMIPLNWVTGVYVAKFTDAKNFQTYTPFDVLGNFHSVYVAVTPDTTYEAYNSWGGASLYAFNTIESDSSPKGVKVSFDRPYTDGYGSSQVVIYELASIRWLERQGYDLSYMSNIDLHANGNVLLQHRTYISLGHDEYWSREMRTNVEHARDSGVGLAFFGANDMFWQIRLETDSSGVPDRTVVCYKVQSNQQTLAQDPLYQKDNALVTAQWRDPVIGHPENSLIGIMYDEGDWGEPEARFPAWHMSTSTASPLLKGTGLQPGQSYGCNVVGYEWDHVVANGATPLGLQILSSTTTVNQSKKNDVSNTAYYIAPSGAFVFATGSIYWTYALDDYRYFTSNGCPEQNRVVPAMQVLLSHIMEALVTIHPSSYTFVPSTNRPLLAYSTARILTLVASLSVYDTRKWERQG